MSQILATGALADGFSELVNRHMLALMSASAVAVAVTLGVVGPIGFYHRESALERVAFALLHTAIGWPIFYGQLVTVFYLMRRRRPAEVLAVLCGAMLLASFQSSATVHTLEGFLHPGYPAESRFLEVYLLVAIVTVCCAMLYLYVVWQRVSYKVPVAGARERSGGATAEEGGNEDRRSVAMAVAKAGDGPGGQPVADSNGVSRTAGAAEAAADERRLATASAANAHSGATAVAEVSAGQPSALFNMLPDGLGTDLIFIKSEDHYLEVHTTAGSSLIKMRFSDAIAELGDRGIKVHRSYWVATRHVTRSVRTGKRTVLRLTGGHRVPVSVTHMRAVRAILPG